MAGHSQTVNNLGFESSFTVVGSIVPIAYTTSSTPIATSAIDSRLYPGARFLVVVQCASDATSTGVTPAVQDGATSSPTTPATANISGTFGAQDGADAALFVSFKPAAARPYFRALLTPAGGSGVVSAVVFAITE